MWTSFRLVYARKRIDISWSEICNFLCSFILWPQTIEQSEDALDELWSAKQTLATYTVRSGFDLCLQAYDFPPESEIIISAVTVPDMARIIRMHGLKPVPVDIQGDGSVSAEDVEALIGDRTKAILIAHLFGNRMQLEQIVAIAQKRGLVLIEDCAEAFCGRGFTGHAGADISMFSFGSIKTSTAFGGALLTVRDPMVLASLKKLQQSYPQHSTGSFLKKTLKYCFFKFLTDSPWVYGSFIAVLEILKIDHHVLIRKWSRSFLPENLLPQVRKRLSAPGLQLLQRRISCFQYQNLQKRQKRIDDFSSLLPESTVRSLGAGQPYHHYWLCPIRVVKAGVLVEHLYREGFDAADGGTSLAVVYSESHSEPARAEELMKSIVYIPMDHIYAAETLLKLVSIVRQHCK